VSGYVYKYVILLPAALSAHYTNSFLIVAVKRSFIKQMCEKRLLSLEVNGAWIVLNGSSEKVCFVVSQIWEETVPHEPALRCGRGKLRQLQKSDNGLEGKGEQKGNTLVRDGCKYIVSEFSMDHKFRGNSR